MRPVMTLDDSGNDRKQGLFHCWGSRFYERAGGAGCQTLAIVEFHDGGIAEFEPGSIRFLDAPNAESYRESREQELVDFMCGATR